MANFNPGLNPSSDPDYDRVRGLDLINVEGHNKELSSRRTAESLFAGAKAAVVGADNVLQEGAKSELQSGYDKLIGAQGVDLAAGNAVINPENNVYNPSGGGIPTKEQQFLAEGMERLSAAKDQGKISNTHYYAQLEALVRNVKSRYPGYNEIIDRQIEGIAGIKPANALRQSMMHDLEAQAAAKAEKLSEKEKYILHNAQYATPADREEYDSGKIDVDHMVSKIQTRRGEVEDLNARTAQLTYDAKSTEYDQTKAEIGAGGVVNAVHALAVTDIKTLADQAQKDLEAGAYDPAKYGVALQANRLKFMEESSKRLHMALDGKMSASKISQIIDETAKRYDDYAQAFTKEGSGLLGALSTRLAAEKDRDTLKLLNSEIGVPLRSLIQAGKLGSPDLVKDMWNKLDAISSRNNQPNLSSRVGDVLGSGLPGQPTASAVKPDPMVKTLVFDNKVGMGTGTPGFNDPKKLIENLHKIGKDQPTNVEMVLNSWHDNLTNASYPENFVKESARALFSEGNNDFLVYAFKDFDSRKKAFELLTSPQVTASMEKLKGQPEYKAYQKWAYDNYTGILKQSMNALSEIAARPYLDLKFDEATGHFALVPNAAGEKIAKEKWYNQSIPFNVATGVENLLGRGLSENVRMLNSATDNVKKIMDGDGYRVGEQVKSLSAALARSSPEDKRGVWNWIAKSIQLPQDIDLDKLEFGGTHPNFTNASGTDAEDPRSLYQANLRWTKPGLTDKDFATTLAPDEEQKFREWVKANKVPFDPDAKGPQDYDMRGFYHGMLTGDPAAKQELNVNDNRIHYSDKWKTPYHKSFSKHSQWATEDAPEWKNDHQLVDRNGRVLFDEKTGKRTPEAKGLTSLIEDASIDSSVRMAAKNYYAKGMDILENEGNIPRHIAQGFMANFKVESGFDPAVLSGQKKGDGGLAVGLAQWHPDRQAEFRKYWGKDLSKASYEEQVRFVLWELDHMESAAKAKIMKARTAAEAAALVDAYYERSSGEHRGKRVREALNYAAAD